jgi:hypothetical protein
MGGERPVMGRITTTTTSDAARARRHGAVPVFHGIGLMPSSSANAATLAR